MRQLPLGIWIEAAALIGILAALLLVIAPVAAVNGNRQWWRRGFVAAGIAVGSFVMYRLAVADARESTFLIDDDVVAGAALAAQVVIAAKTVLELRPVDEGAAWRAGVAFFAVIATSALLVPIGRSLPAAFVVPAIVLVAARFAKLPLPDTDEDAPVVELAEVALFVWAAAVLLLQSRTLGRPGGVGLAIAAMGAGCVVIAAMATGPVAPRVLRSTAGFIAGSALVCALFVLVPSRPTMRWLFAQGFDAPSLFELRDERTTPTRLERWYDTNQSADAALVDAHRGMGPRVSEWGAHEGRGIDGHLWGYHLDTHVWAGRPKGERPPTGHGCRDETRTCVLVVLRRSDNLVSESDIIPLELPRVPPSELSPR